MLVTPYGLGASKPAGTALSPVNIVAIEPLIADTPANWSTQTFTFDSATGNILVLFGARSNAADPLQFSSVTWAGDALTEELDVETNATYAAIGWAGWIRGGAIGEKDLIITAGGAKQRDLFGYAISFDRLADPAIGGKAGSSVRVEQAAHGVAVTATSAMGRLISLVCAMSSAPRPYSVSSGWELIGPVGSMPNSTGPDGTGDISGVLGTRLAGAPGAYTMTGTSTDVPPSTTDDWLALALEVLPA